MSSLEAEIRGIKELRAAVNRNPKKVLSEARIFLQRGIAEYQRGIIRNPWRVGSSSGGSPVSNDSRYQRRNQKQRAGNLRDSHRVQIMGLTAKIGPDMKQSPYAGFVHEGTRRMQSRPWLDYVKDNKDKEVKR
jgi:hypothetical protein